MRKSLLHVFALLIVLSLVLTACGGNAAAPTQASSAATQAPAQSGGELQIPDIEQGKYNVAFVLIGPHDDGGWSQAHY
ncbi:MAG: hypothetical protein ACM3XO_28365, partial [Bacteroidota bacterium]